MELKVNFGLPTWLERKKKCGGEAVELHSQEGVET